MKSCNFKSTILVAVQFLLILAIAVYAHIFGNIYSNILMLIGIGIGLWAILTMRLNVNIFPEVRTNQELFLGGPYKYVRHPMYLGVLVKHPFYCTLFLNSWCGTLQAAF